MIHKLQKEINELLSLKFRTIEQQKHLHHLLALQQKLGAPKSGKGSRNAQNQVQVRFIPSNKDFINALYLSAVCL